MKEFFSVDVEITLVRSDFLTLFRGWVWNIYIVV